MRLVLASLTLLLVAAGCGPVSPERAAQQCEEQARRAAGPTGEVSIGANSSGRVTTGVSIGISSDFLRGRDPERVYEECVFRKTGEAPVRPLEL